MARNKKTGKNTSTGVLNAGAPLPDVPAAPAAVPFAPIGTIQHTHSPQTLPAVIPGAIQGTTALGALVGSQNVPHGQGGQGNATAVPIAPTGPGTSQGAIPGASVVASAPTNARKPTVTDYVRDALWRALRGHVTDYAHALVAGAIRGPSDALRFVPELSNVYQAFAERTLSAGGIKSAEHVAELWPRPSNLPTRKQTPPAARERILTLRRQGLGAVAIAKDSVLAELRGTPGKAAQPSWIRQVYISAPGGDPAPLNVRQADAEREARRNLATIERLKSQGLIK